MWLVTPPHAPKVICGCEKSSAVFLVMTFRREMLEWWKYLKYLQVNDTDWQICFLQHVTMQPRIWISQHGAIGTTHWHSGVKWRYSSVIVGNNGLSWSQAGPEDCILFSFTNICSGTKSCSFNDKVTIWNASQSHTRNGVMTMAIRYDHLLFSG